MLNSLRGQLAFFWVLLLGVCTGLAVVMIVLYQSSVGAQVEQARANAERACEAMAARYARSIPDPPPADPPLDLLQVVLQLVLAETPHVEGGIWRAPSSFLAYAYPTYEGSGVKRDVPVAEQPHIAEIAALAARSQTAQTDVVRGSREALVVSACPLRAAPDPPPPPHARRLDHDAHAGQRDRRTQQPAHRAGGVAADRAGVGRWLGTILLRGLRHVQRLEALLAGAAADGETMPALAPTGVIELDRLVDGFNRYRARFDEARAHLRGAAQQRSRDQRLAAMGRMTAAIAHEIRNPIAAMRLKAENALAAAGGHADALQAVLGQIARLEGLVQSLLALVQPISLAPQNVDVPAWLAERAATARPAAAAKDQRIVLQGEPLQAVFDPVHTARAVDNLLDNAVRHAPQGGTIRLSATIDAARRNLCIRVDDDGPGVPEALLPRLFEPFATARADGNGLGLALAREVAIAQGGDLRHVALAPGTRFELELPWRTS